MRAEGRIALLIYDGYRSHLSLQVQEEFSKTRVIVCALPSHTSGKTQPLDMVMFAAFKAAVNKTFHQCTGFARDGTIDFFGLCNIMRVSYEAVFIRKNVKAAFRRSGLWPVDASRFLGEPRPENSKSGVAIARVDDLTEHLEQKRKAIQDKAIGSAIGV